MTSLWRRLMEIFGRDCRHDADAVARRDGDQQHFLRVQLAEAETRHVRAARRVVELQARVLPHEARHAGHPEWT
jgi:hypothetical protein